jgi:hypothetical protein
MRLALASISPGSYSLRAFIDAQCAWIRPLTSPHTEAVRELRLRGAPCGECCEDLQRRAAMQRQLGLYWSCLHWRAAVDAAGADGAVQPPANDDSQPGGCGRVARGVGRS